LAQAIASFDFVQLQRGVVVGTDVYVEKNLVVGRFRCQSAHGVCGGNGGREVG